MADTYSKLLGLSDAPTPPSNAGKEKPARIPLQQKRKADVLANQQTSKLVEKQEAKKPREKIDKAMKTPESPTPKLEKSSDSAFLSTKEKTKYGTYLTDESIQKISIRAAQTKRDAHQIVQEAINQYFEKLEN